MGRIRLAMGLSLLAMELCPPAAASDRARGTGTTVAAGRATTRPAETEAPSRPPEKIRELVARLASDRYKVRRAAQLELGKVVNLPGVCEALLEYVKTPKDAETRAALEHIMRGYDQPALMVWYRALIMVFSRGGYTRKVSNPPAPWLFIKGDGSFIYGATHFMFSGGLDSTGVAKWRQGKLTSLQLWRLRDMIRKHRSGEGLGLPAWAQATGVEVAFYFRRGARWDVSNRLWTTTMLGFGFNKSRSERAQRASPVPGLLRKMIVAAPSDPYAGPWCVYAEEVPDLSREEVEKTSDWPIKSVPGPALMRAGGLRLDDEQLKEVRAVLAKGFHGKGNAYKLARFGVCRVHLVPFIKEAREIHFDPGG